VSAIVARDFPATICWNINPSQHCRSYIATISVGRIRNGKRRRITIKASARNDEFWFLFRSVVVPLPPPENLLDIPFGLGAVRKPLHVPLIGSIVQSASVPYQKNCPTGIVFCGAGGVNGGLGGRVVRQVADHKCEQHIANRSPANAIRRIVTLFLLGLYRQYCLELKITPAAQ
jgi:hypothetical protein